jgi:RecB family endonuclease NucS
MGTYRGLGALESETDELIEASEAAFGLERDLQLALRYNIQQIEPGLQIIDDGKEHTTDAGRIDITAKDEKDTIVVIELKAGTAVPESLTQLLAYMGSFSKQEHKQVRGILIAGDFHPRIVYAARAVPNVQLRRYCFKFTF